MHISRPAHRRPEAGAQHLTFEALTRDSDSAACTCAWDPLPERATHRLADNRPHSSLAELPCAHAPGFSQHASSTHLCFPALGCMLASPTHPTPAHDFLLFICLKRRREGLVSLKKMHVGFTGLRFAVGWCSHPRYYLLATGG